MSDKKPKPEPSLAELEAELAERRKDHTMMTTEEARAFNTSSGLRPQSEKHWMSKRREEQRLDKIETDRLARMRFLASGWKRLAKAQAWQLALFHNEAR